MHFLQDWLSSTPLCAQRTHSAARASRQSQDAKLDGLPVADCFGCTLQERTSKTGVSSTGKSKRWSALAFWKKSAGKAKQPAAAAAAVGKADDELIPVRRRSSSYHSSFIALAKQVRDAGY